MFNPDPSKLSFKNILLTTKKHQKFSITGALGKVDDNYVKCLFLKDSCDGSGLNTSENSKDSHPLGLGVFWSDIVQLS